MMSILEGKRNGSYRETITDSGRPENDQSVGMIVVERYYQRLTLWSAPQTRFWRRAEGGNEPQADGTA